MLSISLLRSAHYGRVSVTSGGAVATSSVSALMRRGDLCVIRSIKMTLFGREFGWGGTFNKL